MPDLTPADIYTTLRGANVVLALFALSVMIRYVSLWRGLSTPYRYFGGALAAATVASTWAAIETAMTGVPGGSRVVAATFWLALLTIACIALIREQRASRVDA